jgi:HK97 family phage portal protein
MKFPRFFAREVKESAAAQTIVLTPGQPVWTPRDYKSFAHEGYQKNVIAYQAINRVADAVASVKWGVWRGKQELTSHPILDLLRRPNPLQSGPDFIRAKVGFLMISGNSYDERVMVRGAVKELYTLRPDRMKVIEGPSGMPAGYVYEVGGRRARWDMDAATMRCDIRHTKLFNPLNDWYGMGPIEAGAYAIDQHNLGMAWMQSLLQNSARPSGALVVAADKNLTDDQFARLKAQTEDQHQGARNAGRPMLLEGGLDWKQMGLSPIDMGIIEGKHSSARDVALTFGVPPQLLGIPGDNTYSNYQEARLAFWEDTVLPLLDMIAADWSAWLGEGQLELRPDLDQIPAIAQKRQTLWEMADRAMDLTINERRAMKGYDPIPGGDTLLVSATNVPIEDIGARSQAVIAQDDAGGLAYGEE